MSIDPLTGEIAGRASGPPLSVPGVTQPSINGAGRRFLSDILVELGFVEEADAEQAVEAARHPGQTPEKVLLENGAIGEDQLARALAERYGLDHIDLTEFAVDESAAALLRKTAAKRYLAAPVGFADDGALVLAVADPADSLGLSDIAVMTKLPVRPAVAARSQILKLLDTLVFMEEPAQGASQSVSTVIVPPDGEVAGDPPGTSAAEPPAAASGPAMGDDASERGLARPREELALAIVARDNLMAKVASLGEQSASAVEQARKEAIASLHLEHERELAAAEAAAEEALRAERATAQQALTSLRARHDEALEAERAKRIEEVEAERQRTAAAIDAERERNQRELEALRRAAHRGAGGGPRAARFGAARRRRADRAAGAVACRGARPAGPHGRRRPPRRGSPGHARGASRRERAPGAGPRSHRARPSRGARAGFAVSSSR